MIAGPWISILFANDHYMHRYGPRSFNMASNTLTSGTEADPSVACWGPFEKPKQGPLLGKIDTQQKASLLSVAPGSRHEQSVH